MAPEKLTEMVAQLTSDQQAAVADFIAFLKSGKRPPMSYAEAVEEFISEHPELLRRLAQ